MNTTVTSRRAASKPGSASNADVLLPSNTIRSLPRHAKNKGKKSNNLLLVVLGFFLLSWVGVFVFSGGSTSTNAKLSNNPNIRATRQTDLNLKRKAIKKAFVSNKSNPYEGWQPAIHSDKNDGECKSWRVCFKGRKNSESCLDRCRESPEALGEAPPRPGFKPDPQGDSEDNNEKAQAVEWIPDVTVLHRMLKAGKDEKGNPWPPPLVTEADKELCEDIGNFGGEFDDNKKALNAINIRGMDLLGKGIDWSTKKMKRAPRILCMVYTMEQNHHTNIRVIRETWGPGCDGFLAFSTRDDPRLPAISLPHEGPEEYTNMVRLGPSQRTDIVEFRMIFVKRWHSCTVLEYRHASLFLRLAVISFCSLCSISFSTLPRDNSGKRFARSGDLLASIIWRTLTFSSKVEKTCTSCRRICETICRMPLKIPRKKTFSEDVASARAQTAKSFSIPVVLGTPYHRLPSGNSLKPDSIILTVSPPRIRRWKTSSSHAASKTSSTLAWWTRRTARAVSAFIHSRQRGITTGNPRAPASGIGTRPTAVTGEAPNSRKNAVHRTVSPFII